MGRIHVIIIIISDYGKSITSFTFMFVIDQKCIMS